MLGSRGLALDRRMRNRFNDLMNIIAFGLRVVWHDGMMGLSQT